MRGLILLVARTAGPLGALMCLIAAIGRLGGSYWLAGFQTGTLLLAGSALLLVGCFAYLIILVEKPWPHE